MTLEYTLLKHIQQKQHTILCLLPSTMMCENLYTSLKFLLRHTDAHVTYIPDYDVERSEALSPSSGNVSERLAALYALLNQHQQIVLTTYENAFSQLPSPEFIRANVLSFKVGDHLNLSTFQKNLVSAGYTNQPLVQQPNQFAIRGGIIDLYPAHTRPIRIELDDTTIDQMRHFDSATQRSSKETLTHLEISPNKEYCDIWAKSSPHLTPHLASLVLHDHTPLGWQRYLPLLDPNTTSILSYLPKHTKVIATEDPRSWHTHYQQLPFAPNHIIQKGLDTLLKAEVVSPTEPVTIDLSIDSLKLKKDLEKYRDVRILFVCQSYFRLHQLESTLLSQQIDFTVVESFYESSSKNIPIALCHGDLSNNIILDQDYILAEQNLTERVIVRQSEPTTLSTAQIKIGDLLIHSDHGVGRFSGIQTRAIGDITQDFVVIQYANDDQLLFPPDQLFKVFPYAGDQKNIDTLTSKRFAQKKAKALKNIEAFSKKLLALNKERSQNKTLPLPLPDTYDKFTKAFPFTETHDQLRIMEDIIHDFKQPILFDRLICGDVGFGKTEIAMRAAFIACENGCQVAIIAPTTVLATQHYNSFQSRFQSWGYRIALLSRANKKASEESQAIQKGQTQIIIGTHKLLQESFHRLALVIIDEEHRFGVSQKDSIQAFNKAHKLSLTATPIPRSLNMALSKLRQLSIMSTPPKSRLPIQTYVEEEHDDIIIQALNREVHRGGQAYILYNDVTNMDKIHKRLDKLLPHISFGIVHGQMPATAIEKQMARFHSKAFQVLIASTIIESGIDCANANTIIIFRADKLGLAQIHQIRGRVGRSHHQAFAYLLIPDAEISKKAKQRLEAISQSTHLGAGYELAVADLEIRGAGNLLGDEQSGHLNAIGIAYYTHLLDQATTEIQTTQTHIDLGIPSVIPKDYIDCAEVRYQFYHKIASAPDQKTLHQISEEIEERFGRLPKPLYTLLALNQLRIQASLLSIISIELKSQGILIDVSDTPSISHTHLINTIQKHAEYSFGGPHHILIKVDENADLLALCQTALSRLNSPSSKSRP